jgi:predicted nucleic acid-binding protein
MSEQGKNKLGFTTTNTSKKDCAIRFKNMFERREMIIYSQILYNEMKNYIRKADTFTAQIGSTDDCISATFVVLRMLEEIAQYDQRAYNKLYRFTEQAVGDEWYTDHADLSVMGGIL